MKIYQKLFAGFYDTFMHSFEKKLYHRRLKLLEGLQGNILGVGEGTGINFQFYPDHATIYAVEPSTYMLQKAKLKAIGKDNITFYNYGINDKELDFYLKEKSIDVIVCTLVLCTISDPVLALKNFKKWLKPKGKLIIMEHIHAENSFNKKIQNLFNPVWKIIGDGCHLNRNTDLLIKDTGFAPIYEEYFTRTLRFHSGVFQLKK